MEEIILLDFILLLNFILFIDYYFIRPGVTEIVHPKMKILSVFTHPHVVLTP